MNLNESITFNELKRFEHYKHIQEDLNFPLLLLVRSLQWSEFAKKCRRARMDQP